MKAIVVALTTLSLIAPTASHARNWPPSPAEFYETLAMAYTVENLCGLKFPKSTLWQIGAAAGVTPLDLEDHKNVVSAYVAEDIRRAKVIGEERFCADSAQEYIRPFLPKNGR